MNAKKFCIDIIGASNLSIIYGYSRTLTSIIRALKLTHLEQSVN